ncbi:conserved Plasmodium protein, unknown function [Plasmodium vinckei vinckei]|uniref:Protein phosphatase 1 regulatory subunit 21 N-terminal domain-containing protein n=1 Tax=Plasmodium vinckei vinckei TaxID=54757 RepID=A0A449BQZ4_PLAVN|nr:conserved Plasmodium protein, unknown function [Plasmodium vinckei vinckei]VEV55887.1 conserved Plasmodium protein, unknown function [Plasmodium vinckei vinckei]
MNIEDKYKLIKEKYKELKEQNDILKKAIVEYKKDIEQLEKKNQEQYNKLNLIGDKNNNLLSSNNDLSNKVTTLSNLLEEQKKNNNSSWRNLKLLSTGSKESVHESAAFEELEIKIKENENLYKKIEDLQSYNEKIEKDLTTFRNTHQEKITEKDKIIENLNETIKYYAKNMVKVEKENEEIIKQTKENKIQFDETIDIKNNQIIKIEKVCKLLKNKCYPKYKINFNSIPFFHKYNHCDYYIQNKINEHIKYFQYFISNIIQRFIEYLNICKDLFIFQETQLSSIYNKFENDEHMEDPQNKFKGDYSKIESLKNISSKEIICLEEISSLLKSLKIKWEQNEDREYIKDILNKITEKIKKLVLNTNIYLCIEEYLFPTSMFNKKFFLRNVTRELRNIKNLIIKIINLFYFVAFFYPYNNDNIIVEYFENRSIFSKKKKNIDQTIYNIKATYDDVDSNNLSNDSNSDECNKNKNYDNGLSKFEDSNFNMILQNREKKALSKCDKLKNNVEKNHKLNLFLLKNFKLILENLCYSFKYIKTYISFRICEVKGSNVFPIDNPKSITVILDLTNLLINYIENFNINEIKLYVISLLSYTRFNNFISAKNQSSYLENINSQFNKMEGIPYNLLEKSYKNEKLFKQNNRELNLILSKKQKIIRKLKKNNQQALNEFKNTLMENKELKLNNEVLSESLSSKRESQNEEEYNLPIKNNVDKILDYITFNDSENKGITIKEKQLIEAYVCSCVKINNLNLEIKQNIKDLENMQNNFITREDEIQKLNQQIETYKEEEANIHKKYEEQMNALHDLIVTLEKQVSKLNSEKNVNNFYISCSVCGTKNMIGTILKNRKCISCHSIIIF